MLKKTIGNNLTKNCKQPKLDYSFIFRNLNSYSEYYYMTNEYIKKFLTINGNSDSLLKI